VAVDNSGDIWLAGTTASSDFPVTAGVKQGAIAGGTDAFVAKFVPGPPVSVTITTSPAGLSFLVDGTTYIAPQTFQWGAGNSHSISVPSPQGGSSGVRSAFANWSDGGAQTHTIIVPSTATTYTANFTTQYLLTVTPTVGGIVTVNPASADGYYNSGTSVQLTAFPTFGYAFSSWTGLSSNANPQSVIMNAALSVNANFVTTPPVGLRFVPVTPCRIVDTRFGSGTFGAPIISGTTSRDFPIPQSACGIPSTAQAYSLNVTVVPSGYLGFLTIWPTGQTRPNASTLNSWEGIVVANAAIVPAGANGSVSVYVSNDSNVILDIDGYFDTSTGPTSYSFYTATPCRVVDTRFGTGQFNGPALDGVNSRDFPIPLSSCPIPATARGYSLNFTVVPSGYLGFLSTWPTGQPRPNVSTLNSWTGKVVANAALVPAGAPNESVSVYASNPTNVILDINGYFGAPGSAAALNFYPVTPCRVVDTRFGGPPFGGPEMEGPATRVFPVPASACNIPTTAAAYSLNVTVVPDGYLGFLTIWPDGGAQPNVSTLNSWDGSVVANAAIVPAGTNGAIDVYVTNPTHVILDIDGYFAE
jgi:hypothetical protein